MQIMGNYETVVAGGGNALFFQDSEPFLQIGLSFGCVSPPILCGSHRPSALGGPDSFNGSGGMGTMVKKSRIRGLRG